MECGFPLVPRTGIQCDMRRLLLVSVAAFALPCIAAERLDRAPVAIPLSNGGALINWRTLKADPSNLGFNVFVSGGQGRRKLNAAPIVESSSFVVHERRSSSDRIWVQPAEGKAEPAAWLHSTPGSLPFATLKLQGNYTPSRVAFADLDGDGALDYVIKQPGQVTDPGVWRKSDETFKVEAYKSDGTLLWKKDLGWNIEQGIWYSPMVVYDFNDDGRAEVALKTAPTGADYRQGEGRVLDGPEYCSILDGRNGKELDRVNWPARGNIVDWGDRVGNRASRHMLGLSCFDGKNAALLVHRGTYTTMRVDAYQFTGSKLRLLWSWNGDHENPPVRGQGLHGIQAADIDEDGKDEVILGSAALDDNGRLLWTTGLGHADACYITDIDPIRPGLEIIYGIEPPQRSNAVCLVEARTGKIIWGFDQPTEHVHSQGLLADVDPSNPGLEFYTGEKRLTNRWMFSARTGKLLSTADLGNLAPISVYWEDSPLKPFLVRDQLGYLNGQTLGRVEGRVLAVGDVIGDWREELVTAVPGEIRIYTSDRPSKLRRTCLLQNRHYRLQVAGQTSGYLYPPQLPAPW